MYGPRNSNPYDVGNWPGMDCIWHISLYSIAFYIEISGMVRLDLASWTPHLDDRLTLQIQSHSII